MLILSDDMTVGMLRLLEKADQSLPQYIHRSTAGNYQAFVDTLYIEIDSIVRSLEDDANVMQMHSENALNADICRQLRCKGYAAHFDKNKRGHADISVEYGKYSWIGEGKKVDGVNNNHLKSGYDQLSLRYVSGSKGADQAGLLVYCFGRNIKHVVAKWRDHLVAENTINNGYATGIVLTTGNEDHAFWSNCAHVSSGSRLRIKHIGFQLHWDPHNS